MRLLRFVAHGILVGLVGLPMLGQGTITDGQALFTRAGFGATPGADF